MSEVKIRPITYDDTEDIIRWRNSDYVRSRFIDQRLFTKESHEYWLKNFVETGKVAQFMILLDDEPVLLLEEVPSLPLEDEELSFSSSSSSPSSSKLSTSDLVP